MKNIGVLIFGDPTRGGTIKSEIKFLSNLYDKNSNDCNFYILTVNPSVTKRIQKQASSVYTFPHKIINVFGEHDFHKLENLSSIVTYPGHSNFFGGYLNDNIVLMYKIISTCTNTLKIPVFIRINDSEIKVRDYRLMSKQRLDAGAIARAEGKPDNAFMKDLVNVAKAEDLVSWKEWNYNNIYWFANGSKDACDWVAETLYDREPEEYRMASRQLFVDNTVYVSDDIFFLIRKNFKRFESRYEDEYGSVISNNIKPSLCYLGFFDTVNTARTKAFSTLFKENKHNVPLKIFGKGTNNLSKLSDKPNIDIEEGYIEGDSNEYFDFLHNYLAYVFIGKGQSISRYIGKTAYDAVVARTPILVYSKCDSNHITLESDEYYFSNEQELKEKVEKLKDTNIRQRWIEEQRKDIFAKLPPSTFNFGDFCVDKPELSCDIFMSEVETITKTHIKPSTPLF
ncbi:hypothetical protein M0P25_04735 [archaeon]|jgi:hypothetical protein|nr:hypothetical protein [archaeon]MCK9439612.1 hypothetical protein [Patescibacteria group bacterium]